jgi:hypothetical protein
MWWSLVAHALPTSPNWEVHGTYNYAGLGQGLTAGDLDGDGDDELLVYTFWVLDVYAGGPEGLSEESVTTLATDFDEYFGTFFAEVGDLDGDGYDDVAVGTSGAVLLFLGGAAGPASFPDLVLQDDRHAGFGSLLGPAGDVDGDGLLDLAIGDWGRGGAVFAGAPGGVEPSPLWAIQAGLMEIKSPGDLDGDGFAELLLRTAEEILVYPGSAAGPASSPSLTLQGGCFSGGDSDGDGRAELLRRRKRTG